MSEGFESRAFQIIREVLGEEGWWPSDQPLHPDEAVLMVDIDDVADKIVCRLRGEGLL